MSDIVMALMIYASAATGLPLPSEPPEIIRESSVQLMMLRRTSVAHEASDTEVLALYHRKTGTIHLPQNWRADSTVDLSILLHEIVHHLQTAAGVRYDCARQAEKIAYDTQEKFLAESGIDMEKRLEIDPFFRLLATSCMADSP